MPQLQVIDTTRNEREPSGVSEFFSKLGSEYKDKQENQQIGDWISQYQQNRQDPNAFENLQLNVAKLGLDRSNMNPTKRLQIQQELNQIQKNNIEKDKALNIKAKQEIGSLDDRERKKDNLLKSGWPEYSAEIYLDSPPGVQQTMFREHEELVKRGLRQPIDQQQKPNIQPTPQQQPTVQQDAIEQPQIADLNEMIEQQPEELVGIAQSQQKSEQEQWPAPEVPEKMTPADFVKWENSNEKLNNKELKETQLKKKTLRDTGFNLASMSAVNESKKLPNGLGKMLVIDPSTGDVRPTALLTGQLNPETELYVKNLKQFLKGAKDFFGARVTNFDVSSFMAQLPSLLNSEQGRRVILKQMEYVNQLEQVHNSTLNEGLKHYGRKGNYNQISKVVDEKVSQKEQDLLFKINNLVGASRYMNQISENPEKFKDTVLMQNPEGQYMAVPKEKVEGRKAKQWRVF